jgi:hypothetical protein
MTSTANSFQVQAHFDGKDVVVERIYEALLKHSRKFGPVKEEPKKTSIHLVNKTAFAGVATRKNAVILTLKSDRNLNNSRISKSEQTSAHRYHHELKLTNPAEVDDQLVAWLKEGYALSG